MSPPTRDEIADAMRGLDNITRAVVDRATAELRQRVQDLERELADALRLAEAHRRAHERADAEITEWRKPLRLRCDPLPPTARGSVDDWYDEVIIDRDPAGNPRFRTSRRALVECDDTEVLGPVLLTISVAE